MNKIINALEATKKIKMGETNYYNVMLAQRVEGPTNAGSSYNMAVEEIAEAIKSADWQEVQHPSVMAGCTAYKAPIAGLVGILPIEELEENTVFYAIDPKGTGKISIGAVGVSKIPCDFSYLIIGKEEIEGKETDVVYTIHAGEPVSPSLLEAGDIKDGDQLTKAQALELGFSLCKYMSPEMVAEYEQRK